MTSRVGAFIDSCHGALVGNSKRWIASAVIALTAILIGWAFENALDRAWPWLACGLLFSLLGVALFGYHALRLEQESKLAKLTTERDANAEALRSAVTQIKAKDNALDAARSEVERARKLSSKEAPLPKTLEHLGCRWRLSARRDRNVAYCHQCHQAGRLTPLEVREDGEFVMLNCFHPDHIDEFVLRRSKAEFRQFENIAHTTIHESECT